MHTCSVIEVLESVASSLAVNEDIGDEERVTVVDFKGDASTITVDRVSVSTKGYTCQGIFPIRMALSSSNKMEEILVQQLQVKKCCYRKLLIMMIIFI